MTGFINALPLAFIPLFVAIDIFAVLPLFLSLTRGMEKRRQDAVIRESIITALFVSLAFIGAGEAIFRILGITADDFKIAGGLVLLVFAILDLIRRGQAAGAAEGKLGVVPIGVPLIVGPAVLTTLLVLVEHQGILATIVSLLLNLVIVWISFKKGPSIVRVLGEGGVLAISKIMALLLASIAVMMIRIGIENLIRKAA